MEEYFKQGFIATDGVFLLLVDVCDGKSASRGMLSLSLSLSMSVTHTHTHTHTHTLSLSLSLSLFRSLSLHI